MNAIRRDIEIAVGIAALVGIGDYVIGKGIEDYHKGKEALMNSAFARVVERVKRHPDTRYKPGDPYAGYFLSFEPKDHPEIKNVEIGYADFADDGVSIGDGISVHIRLKQEPFIVSAKAKIPRWHNIYPTYNYLTVPGNSGKWYSGPERWEKDVAKPLEEILP